MFKTIVSIEGKFYLRGWFIFGHLYANKEDLIRGKDLTWHPERYMQFSAFDKLEDLKEATALYRYRRNNDKKRSIPRVIERYIRL